VPREREREREREERGEGEGEPPSLLPAACPLLAAYSSLPSPLSSLGVLAREGTYIIISYSIQSERVFQRKAFH